MLTFGREHEKVCSVQRVKGEGNILLVGKLIDAIHDLLEHQITSVELHAVMAEALQVGGSGVWEQAANWLRRLGKEYPELLSLWLDLSNHSSANVRFRAACCLPDMTPEMAKQVFSTLLLDSAKKVREMAIGKMQS
jgi:HEAT repeat protein